MMVLRSLLVLLVMLGCHECSECAAQATFSFSLPFDCGKHNSGKWRPTGVPCLADPFDGEQEVVLIGGGDCIGRAKTAGSFVYDATSTHKIKATRLVVQDPCPVFYGLAVVGVNREAVRMVVSQDEFSVVYKNVESECRQRLRQSQIDVLQQRGEANPEQILKEFEHSDHYSLSAAPPEVHHVAHVRLLLFKLKDSPDHGPALLVLNKELYILKGWCSTGHYFFWVNDRLYLKYLAPGCGSGALDVYVYDVSDQTPKQVYVNSALSR